MFPIAAFYGWEIEILTTKSKLRIQAAYTCTLLSLHYYPWIFKEQCNKKQLKTGDERETITTDLKRKIRWM